jgi:tetratricopeptide (TPR) repeat protein
LAAAGAIAIAVTSGKGSKISTLDAQSRPLGGKITHIEAPREGGRIELCSTPEKDCRAAEVGRRLEPGTHLRASTGATAKLAFDDETALALEGPTRITLGTKEVGGLRVDDGNVSVDMNESASASLVVSSAQGVATLTRAKCTVSVTAELTQVAVLRGRVTLTSPHGRDLTVTAGEIGMLEKGREPTVDRALDFGRGIARESIDDEDMGTEASPPGLGELRAKKPGETLERTTAVRLARHRVNVRIVGAVARTEIEEVFANETNDVLEGIFRFPLPSDAQIERLALEVDGHLVEGAFTERERASAIWRGSIVHAAPQLKQQMKEEIFWVPGPWRDPALLEWQRGSRFELRIFPIPKQGSRRIVLAYTQVVPATGKLRRYSYPLPEPGANAGGVEDFSMDVQLRGHSPAVAPVVRGYDGRISNETGDVSRFTLSERRFLPRGDLDISYGLPSGDNSLVAWAHQPNTSSDGAYIAMLLRPRLPGPKEPQSRDYAFAIDTSRSMFGYSLKRASALAVRMIAELSREDRVVLLACDTSCRHWPDGLVAAGATAAERAKRFLAAQTAEGASDVTGALAQAVQALGRGDTRSQQVVYLGDGTATVGPTRPATLTREVKRLFVDPRLRLTAVAVGTDSDLKTLRTLASASRGLVVPYVSGQSVARAAHAALSATFAPRLLDVKVELPQGVSAVAPQQLDNLASGDELVIAGRLIGSAARGDVVLRGRVDDQPFEQRYPLELRAVSGEANAFVPRLFASARIADLEQLGTDQAKTEAIELSRKFSVASRYTSLLVLESQAMFDAFGLDNRRKAELWSGELEDEQTTSDAVGEVDSQSATESAQFAGPTAASGRVSSARGRHAPSAAKAAPQSFAPAPAARADALELATDERRRPAYEIEELPPPPRRSMIPMRRVWERKGEVFVGKTTPAAVTFEKIAKAERELEQKPDRRLATKQLFDLYFKAADFSKATALAERWSERDPLDVEALIARADLAAREGDRARAIRILGSVVDMRPSDFGAQQRLSRLHRWQGNSDESCRFSLALSEFRPNDEKALAEALLCLESTGKRELALELRNLAPERVLRAAEAIRDKALPADTLVGDLRISATWNQSNVDLDLSFIDPDAHRVSWLGAPTRSVITATNVVSNREEGLALRNAKPGEYLIEIARGAGEGLVQGTLTVSVAGTTRQIPFTFDGDRLILGLVRLSVVPRLVPLSGW